MQYSTVASRTSNQVWLKSLDAGFCREFYKTNLPWNYWLLDQVQCSVMASRTSYQVWLKSLDAGKIVTAELQITSVAYFQRKINFSRFSAYLDGSPSQLIRISGVLLYLLQQTFTIFEHMNKVCIRLLHCTKNVRCYYMHKNFFHWTLVGEFKSTVKFVSKIKVLMICTNM